MEIINRFRNSLMSKFRNFCFTSFKTSHEYKQKLLTSKVRFIVFQEEECPDTGRRHLQGYCELSSQLRLRSIKDLFDDNELHIEKRKGTSKQAIAYCEKEETRIDGPWRAGTPTAQGRNAIVGKWLSAIEKDSSISNLSFINEDPGCYMQYRHVVSESRILLSKKRYFKSTVIVYYGKTGTGKTRRVYAESPNVYCHLHGKWYDGYNGSADILYDDFSPEYGISMPFLLQLLDRYPMQVEIKGGSVNFAPKRIFITSNFKPYEWFPGHIQEEALMRRLDVVEELTMDPDSQSDEM